MNAHLPTQRRWVNRLAHLAVVIVVLALAAGTFVLSYTGVHSIALQAGVPTRLARIYPGVFDAALVIACAAALMLREGHWWPRAYAWLSIILVIAVVGAADAVHAMNVALPHQKTAGVVAAAPWVLVLLGFSLWLTMLRQSRTQHTAQPLQPTTLEPDALQPSALQPSALQPSALEPDARRPVVLEPTAPQPAPTVPQPMTLEFPWPEATPAETPAEEAIQTPEPASEAPGETTPDEGRPLAEQAAAENATTDEPGALSPDYEEPPPPFATVPRLRRVRSTPTPPEDDGEEQ